MRHPSRRQFLRTLAAAGAAGPLRAPAVMARVLGESDAPVLSCGVQIGDVTRSSAILWSRADRAARMLVELAADERFTRVRRIEGPAALEVDDFTARVTLDGLPAGEPVFYRVIFEDAAQPGLRSAPLEGRFRTAPVHPRNLVVTWSGDVVGQGWGINPALGGLTGYAAMGARHPDLFIHSGDMIYADNPLLPEVTLDSGHVWRNVVTPAKSKVAESLAEYRGNYAYFLGDANVQRFHAAVPVLAQWDDHEVLNNWHPATSLDRDGRYREKSIAALAARARRAMFDYVPIARQPADPDRVYRSIPFGPDLEILLLDERSYRSPNGPNREERPSEATRMLGPAQLAWAKERLLASRATWKVVASDMPLGLTVRDQPQDGQPAFEAWANGDGPPLGRELELAELLSFIKRHRIRNIVWVTADVHYAAAHHYDPRRAVFKDFDPFWEFVAGPLHAGTFGPAPLDPTFGPEVRFLAIPPGMKPNRPPSEGYQYFGTLELDARSKRLTVALYDIGGRRLFEAPLEAER